MLLITGGCEKYVSYVNAPEFKQKLVVTSFISPSDTLSVIYVTSNQPLYGFFDHEEEPGDVTGTISDGITEIQLDIISSGLSFRSDLMPVIPGNTYTLKISSSKGLYAGAETTIPQMRNMMINIDTNVIIVKLPDYEPYVKYEMSTEFIDIPGENNYYSITGIFRGFKTTSSSEIQMHKEDIWIEERYLTDHDADSDNKIKLDMWLSRSYQYYDSAFISICLMNTGESYYLYHTSLDKFDFSDNPFSEVKPVYSNIEGGLGIFTSYTMDSLRFRLK